MDKFEPREPDYKGDGVAVWVAQDKNGKTILKIKLLGAFTITAFKNEPKPMEKVKPQL